MAEDGNLKFITSLTSVGETYDSVAGSAQNLFSQTQTPMQEMEANTRKLQQALVPLGEKIVELANMVLPPLVAIITAVSEVFGMLPEPVQNFVIILGALLVAFTALTPVIAALAVSFGALNISLLPVIGIIAGVAAAIAGIIAIVKNWGAITEWFGNLWQTVSGKLMELWNGVVVFFTETIPAAFQIFIGFFSAIPNWWSGLWSQVFAFFTNTWNAILQNPIVQLVVTTITSLWENAKKTLQGIWSGICDIGVGAWELLKNVILAPVLLLIDLVTGNFSKLLLTRQISEQYQKCRFSDLVGNPAGGDFRSFRIEAGRGNGVFGPVPVRLSDLVRHEADGVFCLERHQDHGGEYRIHAA